jgi:hypothetical protein
MHDEKKIFGRGAISNLQQKRAEGPLLYVSRQKIFFRYLPRKAMATAFPESAALSKYWRACIARPG